MPSPYRQTVEEAARREMAKAEDEKAAGTGGAEAALRKAGVYGFHATPSPMEAAATGSRSAVERQQVQPHNGKNARA